MSALPPATLRSGPGYWLASIGAMLRWQLTSLRLVFPVLIVVQVLIAAGFTVGMGLFFDEVPTTVALFLSTGASVITLITVGIVVAPQLIADEKASGTYDFTWSLPCPRSAAVAAWIVVNGLVAVPSMIAALAVGSWRYGLSLQVNWRVLAAVTLVVGCASLIGYAVAHAIPNPNLTQILAQVFAFTIFGFTPINYPIENLPAWLSALHRALPFYHMGVVVRDGLTRGLVGDVLLSYLVLAGWTLIVGWVTSRALRQRR
jgi:ABC-2 type transport system permease protein